MPLFDGGRFSSLFDPSLGSDDDSDLVKGKKENLSAAAQQKQEALSFNSELFNPDRLTDADTYDGRRIGGVPRESLDAAETSDYRFQENPVSFIRQQKALADIQGKDPADVTQEDILAYGALTTQKAKEFLMEGYSNVPTEEGKLGPLAPRIDVASTGAQGEHKRDLIQVRNPYTGKNLLDALNTPEDNLDYFSKYNVGRIEKDEQVAKDLKAAKKAKDDAQGKENPNRVFSQEELENSDLKYAANLGLLATDTLVGFGTDIAKLLATDKLRSDVSSKDLKTYKSRKTKEAVMLNIRDAIVETEDPAKKAKLVKSLDAVQLTPEELALTDDVRELSFGRTLANDQTGRTYPNKYEVIEKGYEDAETKKTLSSFAQKYKLGNSSDIQGAAEAVGERFENAKEAFTEAKAAYESGDTATAAALAGDILAETGLAFSDVITKNPEAILPLIAESLPYMLASATKGGFAVITNTFYQQGIEDFEKEHGEIPTNEEAMNVFATSLAAAGTELIGAKLTGVTKALKGKKASVAEAPTKKKGIIKGTVDKAGKVVKGAVGETATEATQTALEELGVKQDLSKIDPKEVFTGGVLGGIAGGGVSGGIQTGAVAVDTIKAVGGTAKKGADVVSDAASKAADAGTADREQAKDKTLPTYDREEHANAIAEGNKYKDIAGQEEDLAELAAIKQDIKEASGAIGRAMTPEQNTKFIDEIKEVDRVIRSIEAKLSRENAPATEAAVVNLSDSTKTEYTEEDATQVVDQVLRTPVARGSEDLAQYNSILENENAPEEVKAIIRGAQDVHQKTVEVAEKSGKSIAQVEAEKLGSGINEEGRKGLLTHMADIKTSIVARDFKKTKKAIASLESFVTGQRNKVNAIETALQEVDAGTRKFGSEVVYKRPSAKKKTTFTLETGSVNLLRNTLKPELDLLEAQLKLAKDVSAAKFKLDEKKSKPVFTKEEEQDARETDTDTTTESITDEDTATTQEEIEEIKAAPAPEKEYEQYPEQEMSVEALKHVPGNDLRKTPEQWSEFIKKIQSGEIKPVVIVEMLDGKPINMQEGNHTVEALSALGQENVTVRVIDRKTPEAESTPVFKKESKPDATKQTKEKVQPEEKAEDVAPVFAPSSEPVTGNTFSVEFSPEDLAAYEASIETDVQAAVDPLAQTENPANAVMAQREVEETLETGTEKEVQQVEEKNSTDLLNAISKELKAIKSHANVDSLLKRTTKLLDKIANDKISGIEQDIAVEQINIDHQEIMKPFLRYEFKDGELDGVDPDSNLSRAVHELANIPYRSTEARAAREVMIQGLLGQGKTLNPASLEQSILVNTYNFYETHGFPTAQQTIIDPAVSAEDVGVKGEGKPITRGGKAGDAATFTDFASNTMVPAKTSSAFSIPNLFASLQQTAIGKKIRKTFDITSKEEVDALNELSGIVDKLSERINALMQPLSNVSQLTQSPIQLLKDAQDNLPANLADTMAVVGLEWLMTRGQETLNQNKTQIGGFLGKSEQEVTSQDIKKFWNKGTFASFIEQDLGAAVLRQLGIKVRDDAHGYLQGKLEISIGNYVLSALENEGEVEFHSLSAEQMKGHFKNASEESGSDYTYTTFVKVPSNISEEGNFEVPANNYSEFKDRTLGVVKKLFNLGKDVREPSLEPITKVSNRIRGVITTVSDAIRKGSLNQGQIPYVATAGMINIIRAMDKATFLRLNGYQEDTSKIPEHLVDDVEDSNRQLVKAYDDMMNFVDKHPEGTEFYFDHFTAVNQRTHTNSNTISLQNSKIHRFVFGAKSWEETFNPVTEGSKTAAIMVAITEAFGMGTDKNVDEKIREYYLKNIMTDLKTGTVHEDFTAAVDLINSGKSTFTVKENEIIAEATKGHKTHGLAGLYALANLSKAIKEGTDVTNWLPREVDGITDGVISAFMQLPSNDFNHVKDVLRAGGVYFENDIIQKANEYGSLPENYDNYEQLTIAVEQELQKMQDTVSPNLMKSLSVVFNGLTRKEIIKTVADSLEKEVTNVTSEGRAFSKAPLMTGAYGAAVNTIIENKMESVIDDLLIKLAQSENIDEASNLLEHMNVVASNGDHVITPASIQKMKAWVTKNFTDFAKDPLTPAIKADLIDVLSETYGFALKQGIITQLGEFIESRSYINGAANLMNRIFVELYNQRVDEATTANNGVPISMAMRNQIVHDLKDEGLLPGFKHASSTSFDDSLQITNRVNKTVQDDKEANYRNTYAKDTGVKVITYKSTDAGNLIRNDDVTPTSSRGGTIRVSTYDTNIGVKAFPLANQSQDGNTASTMMAEGDTHNLFDAIVGNPLTLNNSGQRMSEVWYGNQKDYAMVTAVNEALGRFIAAYRSNLGSKGQNNIDTVLASKKGGISIDLPRLSDDGVQDKQKISSVKQFMFLWRPFLDKTLANRKEILDTVTAVDHYASEPHVIKTVPITETKAEQETVVEALTDQFVEEELTQPVVPQAKVKGNRLSDIDVGTKIVNGYNIVLDGLTESFVVYKEKSNWYIVHKGTGKGIGVPLQKTRRDALDSFTSLVGTHGGIDGFNTDLGNVLNTNKNSRGSSADNVFTGFNVDTFYNTADVAADLIFDNLDLVGNVRESVTHSNHLRNVILSIIKPGLSSLNDLMVQVGHIPNSDNNKGKIEGEDIYVAASEGIVKAGTDMSAQEILTHEYVHAIMEKAINGDTNIQKELRRIFLAAEKVVTVQDFLRRDNQGNVVIPSGSTLDMEMAQAKARRDYIFRNKTTYLHEFAAFGLTNEAFINALARAENRPYKDIYTGSIYNRLKALLANAINWLSNVLQRKGKATNLHQALTQLAKDVNGINKGNQRKVTNYVKAVNAVNSATQAALIKYAVRPYVKSAQAIQAKSMTTKKPLYQILNGTYALGYHATTERFQDSVNNFMFSMGLTRDNMLHKLMVEIRGATVITKPYHKLLRQAKHYRDAAKESMAVTTEKRILEFFDPAYGYTDQDYEDLSTGVLKTDLSSIIGSYRLGKIVDFFKSDRAIDTAVHALKQDLRKKHPAEANYYINQARSLGHFMATGRAGMAEQQLNAHNIALMRTFEGRLAPQGDIESAKRLIDTLATLESIRYTNTRARKLTAAALAHEYNRNTEINGISYMLNIQNDFKKRSKKELFNNDETSMVKGFTHEMYDEFKTMKVGTAADKTEFEKEGYILYGDGSPLSQDQTSGLKNAKMYMYVSKDGLLNKKVTGIVSLTSKQSKGTDLVGFFRDNDVEGGAHTLAYKELNRQKRINQRFLNEQLKKELPLNVKNNWLVPILDSAGETVNYRYMMKETTKIDVLGKKDLAHKVLGRMTASIIDKTETTKYNRELLLLAKDDYDKNYLNDPKLYVKIGPKSSNPKYREIYRLLPRDMQMDIERVWGDNTMIIREDMIGITFGFRKLSFTNWLNTVTAKVGSNLDPNNKVISKGASLVPRVIQHSMRMSGMIWQAAISRAKRNIVFLIPSVLINNVTSNSLISLTRGMPLPYA